MHLSHRVELLLRCVTIRIASAQHFTHVRAATELGGNAGRILRKSYCGQPDVIPISIQGGWTAR